jgi:hypothetical protein
MCIQRPCAERHRSGFAQAGQEKGLYEQTFKGRWVIYYSAKRSLKWVNLYKNLQLWTDLDDEPAISHSDFKLID